METIKQEIVNLLSVREQLKSEKLELIDFDKLIVQLDRIQTLYESYETLESELLTFKENILQKINTMEKAMHVVASKRPKLKDVEQSLQELSEMNPEQLIAQYNKTEARFHTAFPSTFQSMLQQKKRNKNYSSCK